MIVLVHLMKMKKEIPIVIFQGSAIDYINWKLSEYLEYASIVF